MDERPLGWLLSRNPDNPDEMMRINGFLENANGILIWTSFRADQAESLGMGLPGYQEGKVPFDTWGAVFSYDIDLPLSWFEELMVAFRDGDVDGNGSADTIPMSGHDRMAWMWAPVLGAFGLHHNFGVGANGVTNYFEDGQTHLQPISERYRDFSAQRGQVVRDGTDRHRVPHPLATEVMGEDPRRPGRADLRDLRRIRGQPQHQEPAAHRVRA